MRFTEDELADVEAAAGHANQPVTVFIREAAVSEAARRRRKKK